MNRRLPGFSWEEMLRHFPDLGSDGFGFLTAGGALPSIRGWSSPFLVLRSWFFVLCVLASFALGVEKSYAQPIPAFPEPGLILYGTITNIASGQGTKLTNGIVEWRFRQQGATHDVLVSANLLDINGVYSYFIELPFQSGDPAFVQDTNKLTLYDTGTNFFRTNVVVNGRLATITGSDSNRFGSFSFGPSDRGAFERVDLQITSVGEPETYEVWSTRYFGVPNIDPAIDSDNDGRTNAQEFSDGTDPTNTSSVLRFIAVTAPQDGSVTNNPNASSFLHGAGVSLHATPDSGFYFEAWTGQTNTVSNPLSLLMTRNYSVGAEFPPLSDGFATVSGQTIAEGGTLSFTAKHVEALSTGLRFSLPDGSPTGATVDSETGVFNWTPTEGQGPDNLQLNLLVLATNNPGVFATQAVAITVGEVNSAPALAAVMEKSIKELNTLAFTLTANDSDLPANQLTFQLVSGPAGVSVSPAGLFSWTPTAAQGPSTNTITVRVTDNGSPPLSNTNSFTVIVTENNSSPVLAAIANQSINEGQPLSLIATATDNDIPANVLTFSLPTKPAGMTINPSSGQITWTTSETTGPSTNGVTVRVTDNGAPALLDERSFSVVVNEINQAPLLASLTNRTIVEGAELVITNSATDLDTPVNLLTFSLGTNAPTGAAINATNGVLQWTTTEADGPGSFTFDILVTDNGVPSMSATQQLTIDVSENNQAPLLATIPNQEINEGQSVNLTLAATDSDLPANTLSYRLVSGPSGLTVQSGSGDLSWAPTEAQAPSINSVTVEVADGGNPVRTASRVFQVVVNEVNRAPTLGSVSDQSVNELSLLSLSLTAGDADLPANGLTYQLLTSPAGMQIGSGGSLTWTPTEAQGPGSHPVLLRVVDDGVPSLSATQAFNVTVGEVNIAPALAAVMEKSIKELNTLTFTLTANDSDLPTNNLTYSLVSAPTGVSVSPAGQVSWTPTAAQGPSTNTITVRVTDNGSPPLSDTNSFTVIVTENNSSPVLAAIANQSINEGQPLSLIATATDNDIPANVLTFSLPTKPAGMTINPSSGQIAWTTSETTGPSTNAVTVRVTDNGAPALSDERSFNVVVNEVNQPPVLATIPLQTVDVGNLLSVTNSATDADLPANTLTYELLSAPTGVSLATASGILDWTPSANQVGNHNLQLRVFDNGIPSLSATQSFTVQVNSVVRPTLNVSYENGTIVMTWPSQPGRSYRIRFAPSVPTPTNAWQSLAGDVVASTNQAQKSDSTISGISKRFYRLDVLP